MLEMNQLVRELSGALGEDTKNLEMRVGIHSGPVTAGVLRGHKGRFQLFGDSGKIGDRLDLILVVYKCNAMDLEPCSNSLSVSSKYSQHS